MKVLKKNQIRIDEIVDNLRNGGLVIMPTETVYIAAVDATNYAAVQKLIKYKNRPLGKPFSVGVADLKMARDFVKMNQTALNLYKNFYPGPVTIVCNGKHKVALGIESDIGTLGIFITDHKLTLDVIKRLGKPITTTSANASYQKRPFKINDLLDFLSIKQKGLIDLIVDVGEIPYREASTVIDTTIDDPAILRQGEIRLKDKNEVLSRSEESTQNIGKELWQKIEKYFGQRALVFALEGPMGVGKTVFTKGLARAMGIKDEVVSPTYNLEEEYDHGKLLHFDCWRMSSDKELVNLGFGKKITDKSVIVVEWADRVADEVRKHSEEAIIIWVKIEYARGDNERIVSWGTL